MEAQLKAASNSLLQSALHFFSGTLLSRISGMLRDISMAVVFGTQPAVAAFFVGYRLANLFRRLLGEGGLVMGFIPRYETLLQQTAQKAACFFRDLIASVICFIICLLVFCELGLGWFGRHAMSEQAQHIVFLTMLMLPGLLAISLYALFSAYLQCHGKYFISSAAPVLFNFVWIATVFFVRGDPPNQGIVLLAISVTAAFFLQWAALIPSAKKFMLQYLQAQDWFRFRLFSKEVRAMLCSLSLSVVGIGAVQINGALDAFIASYASVEGPAYLNYSIRIYQLPLSLFAIAISSALLPALSKASAQNDLRNYVALLRFSMLKICAIAVPCSIALFIVGLPAIQLIYCHGRFGLDSAFQTARCLWGYSLGLIPASLVVIMVPALYALKDYRSPAMISLLAVAVNLICNLSFVFALGWGAVSVAIATSLAALVNFLLLARAIMRKAGPIWDLGFLLSLVKILTASAAAAMAAQWISGQLYSIFRSSFIQFSVLAVIFSSVYFLVSYILKSKDAVEILSILRLRNSSLPLVVLPKNKGGCER